MERYVVARMVNGKTGHAVFMHEGTETNPIIAKKSSIHTEPLCQFGKGLAYMVVYNQLAGNPAAQDNRECVNFTPEWVETADAAQHKLCAQCVSLIKFLNKHNISYKWFTSLAVLNIRRTSWVPIVKQIHDLNMTVKEKSNIFMYDILITEWVPFVEAWRARGLTFDAAKFLYQYGVPYNDWDKVEGWPLEWLEAAYKI